MVIKYEARVRRHYAVFRPVAPNIFLEILIQSAWSETWHLGCFQKFPRQCAARVENLWWFFGQKGWHLESLVNILKLQKAVVYSKPWLYIPLRFITRIDPHQTTYILIYLVESQVAQNSVSSATQLLFHQGVRQKKYLRKTISSLCTVHICLHI